MGGLYKQAAGLTAVDVNVALNTFWQDVRMEYSGGDIIYKGAHFAHDAAIADNKWEIWKYTWDGSDLTRIEGPLVGAWDDRATLGWGA